MLLNPTTCALFCFSRSYLTLERLQNEFTTVKHWFSIKGIVSLYQFYLFSGYKYITYWIRQICYRHVKHVQKHYAWFIYMYENGILKRCEMTEFNMSQFKWNYCLLLVTRPTLIFPETIDVLLGSRNSISSLLPFDTKRSQGAFKNKNFKNPNLHIQCLMSMQPETIF